MKNNVAQIIEMDKKDCKPLQQLWLPFGVSEILTLKMFKCFKLAEICMV
jgi:hypothetical protein